MKRRLLKSHLRQANAIVVLGLVIMLFLGWIAKRIEPSYRVTENPWGKSEGWNTDRMDRTQTYVGLVGLTLIVVGMVERGRALRYGGSDLLHGAPGDEYSAYDDPSV